MAFSWLEWVSRIFTDAVSQAIDDAHKNELAGVGIKALELAARIGLSNGAFEDSEEEAPAIVEEFYSDVTSGALSGQTVVPMPTKLTVSLRQICTQDVNFCVRCNKR